MLENAAEQTVLANQYMWDLRQKGVYLANMWGITHPSQPNYIASVSGDTFGIKDDDAYWVAPYVTNLHPETDPPVTTIVDLLEAKGLSWKCYAEKMQPVDIAQPPLRFFYPAPYFVYPPPGPHKGCQTSPWFARRHVPFLSFPSVVKNPERLAKIVVADPNFERDLAAGQLPNYTWYTPDLLHDGHSAVDNSGNVHALEPGTESIDNIAAFLQRFLGDDPVSRFPPKTLIVITFDEAFPYTEYDIYTLLIGDMLEAGTMRTEPYNLYSLLRSVEDNFELGTLGRNDQAAVPLWFVQPSVQGKTPIVTAQDTGQPKETLCTSSATAS
jgi:Phosphoesterase family